MSTQHLTPAARGAVLLFLALLTPAAGAQVTVLLDSNQSAATGSGSADHPSSSFDGHFVAFSSDDTVLGAAPFLNRVFVKDLGTWALETVSVSSTGVPADALSIKPEISHDGRYVVFETPATNLALTDQNGTYDVYLRDRVTGTTTAQSVKSNGYTPSAGAHDADISGDGRFVLFMSDATDLVPGITGGQEQVYLRDHVQNTLAAVSISSSGVPSNGDAHWFDVSADGRFVVFETDGTNLVSGDNNGARDVFLRDRQGGTTVRLSVGPSGVEGNGHSLNPAISADGRYVAYVTAATNIVTPDTNGKNDVVVHDLWTGTTERASVSSTGGQTNDHSYFPALSFDGRFVSFSSAASNLVPGDVNGTIDSFVRDRALGQNEQTNLTSTGAPSPASTVWSPNISPNGRFALFVTDASLVSPPPPGGFHVFTRERGLVCITPYVYCTAKQNSLGCLPTMASYGCSSASVDAVFYLLGAFVRNNKTGLLFYSFAGQASNPFQGGTMCMGSPRKRTPIRDSGGNAAPADDCSGLYVIDMNQYAAGLGGGTPKPELSVPGTIVNCQWWSRDPGSSFNVGLTNGLEYLVGP